MRDFKVINSYLNVNDDYINTFDSTGVNERCRICYKV